MTVTMDDLTAVQQKKLRQVQDLLRKAEDEGCTPEEAEALTAKATYLLTEYNIDAALASARSDKREVPADRVLFFPAPYAKQHVTLFYNILKVFGGEAVMVRPRHNSRSQDKGMSVHVYAFEADLTAVDMIYTSLLLQAATQLNKAHVPYYDSARSFRVSWWIGFTNVIIGRLKAAYASAETELTKEPGTAIVLRDRALEVRDKFRADNPKTRRVPGSQATSGSGYRDGERAGKSANIHNRGNVGAQSRTALA